MNNIFFFCSGSMINAECCKVRETTWYSLRGFWKEDILKQKDGMLKLNLYSVLKAMTLHLRNSCYHVLTVKSQKLKVEYQ